jgi:hypothetical protein
MQRYCAWHKLHTLCMLKRTAVNTYILLTGIHFVERTSPQNTFRPVQRVAANHNLKQFHLHHLVHWNRLITCPVHMCRAIRVFSLCIGLLSEHRLAVYSVVSTAQFIITNANLLTIRSMNSMLTRIKEKCRGVTNEFQVNHV